MPGCRSGTTIEKGCVPLLTISRSGLLKRSLPKTLLHRYRVSSSSNGPSSLYPQVVLLSQTRCPDFVVFWVTDAGHTDVVACGTSSPLCSGRCFYGQTVWFCDLRLSRAHKVLGSFVDGETLFDRKECRVRQ